METLSLTPGPKEQNWFKRIFWPQLEDEADVHDAARHGYYACLLICLSTLVMMVLAGFPIGALVDIFFFLMAGVGIRQLSRLASVAAFMMFLVERAAALVSGQAGPFSILGLLMGAILLNSVRAAYAARELRPAGDIDAIANPPMVASSDLWGWLDTLPWILWPKLRVAFMFYLVGLIAMMLVGVVVRQVGLLQ